MKFAIGPKTIFEQAGFKTDAWRHSIDETTVLCHAEYAATLLDLSAQPDIQIYDRNNEAFQEILQTAFTNPNEEILTEEGEPVFDAPVEEPVTDTTEEPIVK